MKWPDAPINDIQPPTKRAAITDLTTAVGSQHGSGVVASLSPEYREERQQQ
jgi:hypothetical protein